MDHVQWESPFKKWRWNMVIKKRTGESRGASTSWRHLNKAFTKHQVLSTSEQTCIHSQWVHHCIYRIKKKKNMSNKAYDTTSDAIPWCHITVWSCIKKFGSHKGTKGSRHKHHSYWTGLFKFTPKVRSPRALGENKNTSCNKELKYTWSNGWPAFFFCFFFWHCTILAKRQTSGPVKNM